jgi:hypothetical protein
MDGARSAHGGDGRCIQNFSWNTCWKKKHLVNQGADWRWYVNESERNRTWRLWGGFIWLSIGPVAVMNFRVEFIWLSIGPVEVMNFRVGFIWLSIGLVAVMNFRVPWKARKLLTSWTTISFSGNLFHGVSSLIVNRKERILLILVSFF